MYNCTGLPDTIKEPVATPVGIDPVNCCNVKSTDALTIWLPVNVLLPVDAKEAVLTFVTYELVTAVSDAISVAKDIRPSCVPHVQECLNVEMYVSTISR